MGRTGVSHFFTSSPLVGVSHFLPFDLFTLSHLITPKVFIPLHEKDENYHCDTRF